MVVERRELLWQVFMCGRVSGVVTGLVGGDQIGR